MNPIAAACGITATLLLGHQWIADSAKIASLREELSKTRQDAQICQVELNTHKQYLRLTTD